MSPRKYHEEKKKILEKVKKNTGKKKNIAKGNIYCKKKRKNIVYKKVLEKYWENMKKIY